jgi:hypothetical protein
LEWNLVLNAMDNATKDRRRRLGGRGGQHCQLTCPLWCGKYCTLMGVGCGQHGRRRQLQNGNDNAYGKGHGGYDEDCNHTCIDGDITPRADGIAAIDAAMMSFTAVSPPCQLLLDGDKTISCPHSRSKCMGHQVEQHGTHATHSHDECHGQRQFLLQDGTGPLDRNQLCRGQSDRVALPRVRPLP